MFGFLSLSLFWKITKTKITITTSDTQTSISSMRQREKYIYRALEAWDIKTNKQTSHAIIRSRIKTHIKTPFCYFRDFNCRLLKSAVFDEEQITFGINIKLSHFVALSLSLSFHRHSSKKRPLLLQALSARAMDWRIVTRQNQMFPFLTFFLNKKTNAYPLLFISYKPRNTHLWT